MTEIYPIRLTLGDLSSHATRPKWHVSLTFKHDVFEARTASLDTTAPYESLRMNIRMRRSLCEGRVSVSFSMGSNITYPATSQS
eukprot:4458825-Karenia_brevis.AAC.1